MIKPPGISLESQWNNPQLPQLEVRKRLVLRHRFQIDFFAPHQSLPELPSVEAQQQSVFHRRSLDQRGNPRRQSPRSWIDGLSHLQLVYLGSRTRVPIPVGMTNPVLARQSETAD